MRRMKCYFNKLQGLFWGFIGILAIVFLFQATVEAGTLTDELILRKKQTLDTDLVVSAASLLLNVTQKRGVQIVDVRTPKSFNELHIHGSINIPLHFIRTKTFLRSSPMVLVGPGLSTHRLAPICKDLNKMGFDVRILDGGLTAWKTNGGEIVGNITRSSDFGMISAKDFFIEKNFSTRIVCDVSTYRSQASIQLLPDAVHLPLTGTENSQIERIREFRMIHYRNGYSTIIVVNKDGEGYRSEDNLFTRVGCKNVFYLQGGLNAYGRYLDGLVQSWRPPEDRLISENSCRKCMESF